VFIIFPAKVFVLYCLFVSTMVKPFVKFSYADQRLTLANKKLVQAYVLFLVKRETGVSCRLQYVFCSDSYLHQINLSFLQHDDYTDIITFDLSENRERVIEGEIYISIDRVRENSEQFNTSFEEEILRVIFHGALHLCGYKDKSVKEKAIMRRKEDFYINEFFAKGST
jgi:rRNA maturation RNase YbeY